MRPRGRRWEDVLWVADDLPLPLRLVRAALMPVEALYRLAVLARGYAYDQRWMPSVSGAIPTLGVGNLTVGGTGKTPFAAWAAAELQRAGLRPAIALRGYGDDETAVHAALNPGIPVVADPDRRRAVRTAAGAGAGLAILDDAFQHRRLKATVNVLLIAAEDFHGGRALLPRGRWREPLSAARRAGLVVVTRKIASASEAERAAALVAREAPSVPQARIALAASDVREYREGALGSSVVEELLSESANARLALAGVARPDSVWAGLDHLGIAVPRLVALRDHHRYTAEEARALAEAAGSGVLLTTLKDAVKLEPLLPRSVRLCVLMQEVVWEAGWENWERCCGHLTRAAAQFHG
ncbi:MAG: tetraacyldisaccharide 4'-kinase [Gemmatimonadetes bacterium]|nr:tetraacyldisaccharide 4'-kinase [Gemmatimonadota bacterium]